MCSKHVDVVHVYPQVVMRMYSRVARVLLCLTLAGAVVDIPGHADKRKDRNGDKCKRDDDLQESDHARACARVSDATGIQIESRGVHEVVSK